MVFSIIYIYIYIYITSIFFSKCTDGEKFTIKKKQFEFHTLYEKDNHTYPITFENEELTIDKGLNFQDIINKLSFKSSRSGVSVDMVVMGEGKTINEKIIDGIKKSGFFLEKISDKEYKPVSLKDVFTSKHLTSTFSLAYFFSDILLDFDGKKIYISDKGKVKFIEFLLKYFEGFNNWEEFRETFFDLITKELDKEGLTCDSSCIDYKKYIEEFLKVFSDNFHTNKYNVSLEIYIHKNYTNVKDLKFHKELLDGFTLSLQDYKNSLRTLKLELSSKNIIRKILPDREEYLIKPGISTSVACGDFFYVPSTCTLGSNQLKRLLEGNGYDYCKYFGDIYEEKKRGGKIFIQNGSILVLREKVKLNFKINDTNTLKFKDEDFFKTNKFIYKDELEDKLKQYGPIESFKYDKESLKKDPIVIEIIKPIEGKVDYVQKNVKFKLDWNLKDIYDLKIDKDKINKNLKIDATSTLKSVLREIFKELNTLLKIDDEYCPDCYEVFNGESKKLDPENYKILKDEDFTIKLDIFDENYFEKKNCTKNLKIEIEDYKEVKNNIEYIKVPKYKEFTTLFKKDNDGDLLKKMLKEELHKKIFTNSKDIEFEKFSIGGNVVTLSIKNLAKEDIKETQFVTTITLETPKYFRNIKGYTYFDYSINKDSTVEDAIKDISEFIKKEYKYSTAPVFESIKYGNGDLYRIDNNKSNIIPSKAITLKFKADEKLNKEYISERFPVVKFVNIELKQDNNYFALKKDVDDIIKEISPVYLHEDATCKDFLEKVTKQLRDKKNATNPPALSFKNKINVEGLVSPVVSDNLYLYLDPFSSSEYVENNKNFEGVVLYFKLKCCVGNYKLKNDYNNRDNALVVKDINNGKVTFKDIKKALEEQYKIQPNQCNIYVNNNKEFKDEDIISVTNFVVGITDSSLLDYLTPLKKMTFTIDYKYDTDFYKLKNNAPKELTVSITEEDLNKNIYNFISDHIITIIKNQNKGISDIYLDRLNNNNEFSYVSNEKVKDCIKKDEKNIVVLELYSKCNLLESKGKPKIEEPKKIGKKEEIKKEEENIDEEKSKEKSKERHKKEKLEKKSEVETTLKDKGMKTPTPEKKSKEKLVGESGKKSGKTTLKSGDVKNSTEVKKGGCCRTSCKNKGKVESTEKKVCSCCGRN